MKLHHLITALGGGALLVLGACSQGESTASPEAGAVQAADSAKDVANLEPDVSLVEARSAARWELVVLSDWIQVYDYQLPALRKEVPIGQFLSNKEFHEYRAPSKPRLIGAEGEQAFVELSVLWEPHHPIIIPIPTRWDDPDQAEELHVVETWSWHEGEWFFVENERAKDFHGAHPGLATGAGRSQPR